MHRGPTVAWFIPVNHRDYDRMSASVWIRCLQLIPYLEARGVRCTVNEPNGQADIAVFVRWQDDKAYELAQGQRKERRRIVFDVCVNYFDETGTFPGGYGSTAAQVREARRMVRISDAVTCGSKFIEQRAKEFHPRAVYLPESIDRRHFAFEKPLSDFDKPTLTATWSGQPVKAGELADLSPLLRRYGIPLVVISEAKPQIPGPFTYVPWSYHTFPQTILQGDLCVTPRRTDNPYDLGHSHLKIGIFMAQGVPALASPQPSYCEVIEKTGGGKICGSEADWENTLAQVLEDRRMLKRWSQAAREGMEEYSTESVTEKYIRLFEDLCEIVP